MRNLTFVVDTIIAKGDKSDAEICEGISGFSDNHSFFKENWEWVLQELTRKKMYKSGAIRIVSKVRDRSENILGLNVIRCWKYCENEMRKAGYNMVFSNRFGVSLWLNN